MNPGKPSADLASPNHSHEKFLVALAFSAIIMVISTALAGWFTKKVADNRLVSFFERQADHISSTYYNKLYTHLTVLEGIRGLWNISGNLEYDHFLKYMNSLNADTLYQTGVSSFFYIPQVSERSLPAFIEDLRSDISLPKEYRTYEIKPGETPETNYPIKYIYPLEDREEALGKNFASSPIRLEAITYARSTGWLATTKPEIFATTGKPGFLFLLPLYDPNLPVNLESERTRAFLGLVGSGFRSEETFKQIFGTTNPYPDLDFQIYQGEEIAPNRLLYDHDPEFTTVDSQLEARRVVRLKGQSWTIVVQGKPSLRLGNPEEKLPIIIFSVGMAVTALTVIISLYAFIRHIKIHPR